jgi:hypothetical protein
MDPDQRSPEETEQRLQKLLEGAFSGPPTPLKRIPKRNGKSRSSGPSGKLKQDGEEIVKEDGERT